jgi:predicted outer membrane repeat protein
MKGTVYPVMSVTIKNSFFYCQQYELWYPGQYTKTISYIDSVSQQIGNLYYFESSVNGDIISQFNEFRRCYGASEGAVFYLPPQTTLTDTNSKFIQNSGTYGGNIYCDSCTLSFTNTIFTDSLAYEGSVIFMINSAFASFSNVAMNYGKARHYGGAIYVGGSGPSTLSLSNCASDITYFESYYDGGFLYVANPSVTLGSQNCCFNHYKAA